MDEEAPTPDVDPDGAAPRSIGAYLAAQRQLRGIPIEELSRQTRIPLRSLERLEAGSFDADVDGFVRGFVRTVAEALGLDPDETLNRTLQEPGHGGRKSGSPQLSVQRVLVALAGLGLLVALGFGVQWVAVAVVEAARAPNHVVSVRRDPVRALAEAQGVAGLQPAPALALAARAAPAEVPVEAAAADPDRAPVASPASP